MRALDRTAALVCALVVAPSARSAEAQVLYENPVLGGPQAVADPFILKWNGEYYLYTTGDPIMAYHSTDLIEWDEIGPVLHSAQAEDAWNQKDVWAPEVVYRNGTFYMSYTATRASEDWRVEERERRIGVATAGSPRGPFVDPGHPVTPGWGIDSHVFRDPDTGRDYLFYSYLYEPNLPGAGIVVDSMPAPTRVTGATSHVTRGSEPWEDKDGDPNNGSLRYTNEAPAVLKRNGLYYMLYSGGSWDRPTYSLAYAVSERVMQGGLDGPGWRKVIPPILRGTALVQAPGHNCVVLAPNNVDLVTAYHARAVPFDGPGARRTFLDRLYWNHDRPFIPPPSLGPLPAPDRPIFGDLFNRADGSLGSAWTVVSGAWRIGGGQAQQTRRADGLALARTDPLEHYVFEANVRIVRGSSGAAGVLAYYVDADHRVDVWLDAGRRALVTGGVLGGRAIPTETTALDGAFRFDVYHQILITKNADRIRVSLDGVDVQRRRLELGAGGVGVQTRDARADFDGVALSAYFEDGFDDSTQSWTSDGGTWRVDDGALRQSALGPGRSAALKGEARSDYEFTASVRWLDEGSEGSKVGVVAAAESGRRVVGAFDRRIWPFARFFVQSIEAGAVRSTLEVGLPRGFLYDVYHTIRVVKQGEGFTFYLDGSEIAAVRIPMGDARPGLFTEGARAAFDDAAMKRLVVPHNLVLDGGFESERWDASAPSAPHPPWRLSGGAFRNMCCAHSGDHRLVLRGADARATQTVPSLPAGRYTLLARVTTRDAEAELEAGVAGGATTRARASGGDWRRARIDFEVPEGRHDVTISLAGRVTDAGGLVAIDDVYLFRR